MKKQAKLLSTKEAAEKLGISQRRVQKMIEDEQIVATLVGSRYVISESDLAGVVVYGESGRPKKQAE